MLKIMLDTMIYDYLVTKENGPELVNQLNSLIMQGEIEVIATHVQEDELALTQDANLLSQIYAMLERLPRRRVPTAGMAPGVSRLGEFRLADETTTKLLKTVRTDGGNHTRDALIGGTANVEADVLVTDDKRLTRRLQSMVVKCQIWTFEQLYRNIMSV